MRSFLCSFKTTRLLHSEETAFEVIGEGIFLLFIICKCRSNKFWLERERPGILVHGESIWKPPKVKTSSFKICLKSSKKQISVSRNVEGLPFFFISQHDSLHKPREHQGASQQQECFGHGGRKLSERKDQGNVDDRRGSDWRKEKEKGGEGRAEVEKRKKKHF